MKADGARRDWGFGKAAALAACLLLACAGPLFAQALPGGAGTVTLPLAEYDKLVERAARPPAPVPLPPVPAVVARGDFQVRVSATDLRGTLTVSGEVLRDGRAKVPLMSGATLIEVQQAANPVAVVNDSGVLSAILPGPGPFTLVVVFGSDVQTEPGRASAMLPAIRAGSVHATIEAPGDNADVRVERGLIGSRSSAAGKTTVEVTLEPGVPSRVTWSSRDQAVRVPREVRLVSDVKSLVTVGETDLRLAALLDINVLQGQPDQFDVLLPEGFDVVNASGPSIEAGSVQGRRLPLAVREPARRRHQVLVTLERTVAGGVKHAELALPGVQGAQRETGEVAWEAVGTVDLTATEAGPLRRLDIAEVSPSLASLARTPLLSAFRYQRRGDERVPVTFDVQRFADARVLGAAADSATVTTLVSSEGRALTEINLLVRNRGQLFMKVGLPKGATLVSAEVGGQAVKPVDAPDAARVPLTRVGFQPDGAYSVSFVYVEAGTPFDKKGEGHEVLPRLDVPIGVLAWEIFLPERFKVKRFEGDAMPADLMPQPFATDVARYAGGDFESTSASFDDLKKLRPDQVGGRVEDPSGAVLPGVSVTVLSGAFRKTAVTNASGVFVVSGVPAGPVTIIGELQGFRTVARKLPSVPNYPVQLKMQVAALEETVKVTGESQVVEAPQVRQKSELQAQAPSVNVFNLQQRVAGVLPVRIDIPRAGQSFRFVRPLVLDEETTLRFQYKAQ